MRTFDFLGKAKYFVPLSLALVVASVLSIALVGLRAGVDFTGGTQFTVFFPQPVTTEQIRSLLAQIPTPGVDLAHSQIQNIQGENGKVITIALDVEEHQELVNRVEAALRDELGATEVSRASVGAQVSRELVNKTWQAILIALAAILVYISWRFRLRYAVGAIAALVHDVLIAVGVFSILQVEINLPVIAAFLTIVGYSLNDTIVIFDRVRENLKVMKKASIYEVINRSVTQSLSRTINTSLTTFIPVVILFALGGPVLRGFALALLIGVIVGTYSSMYVANPILYWWTRAAEKAKGRA
ncbi:MAG: Bifunctional preprotein translocase subunit SecD/SecF [Acetothermia bacterium 64_32]|nr:MAG: Bifunctional preprotein translocase subunit SecD/SecF [Acetothermia bacterium 64_32]HAF70048.1 protein translocase subunit SecF [Candidatus Acetothermia bacterium]